MQFFLKKGSLKLQIEQRELYEKQFCEIMDFLNIPIENRSFENIMPAIRDLKDALELSEIDNYANPGRAGTPARTLKLPSINNKRVHYISTSKYSSLLTPQGVKNQSPLS